MRWRTFVLIPFLLRITRDCLLPLSSEPSNMVRSFSLSSNKVRVLFVAVSAGFPHVASYLHPSSSQLGSPPRQSFTSHLSLVTFPGPVMSSLFSFSLTLLTSLKYGFPPFPFNSDSSFFCHKNQTSTRVPFQLLIHSSFSIAKFIHSCGFYEPWLQFTFQGLFSSLNSDVKSTISWIVPLRISSISNFIPFLLIN